MKPRRGLFSRPHGWVFPAVLAWHGALFLAALAGAFTAPVPLPPQELMVIEDVLLVGPAGGGPEEGRRGGEADPALPPPPPAPPRPDPAAHPAPRPVAKTPPAPKAISATSADKTDAAPAAGVADAPGNANTTAAAAGSSGQGGGPGYGSGTQGNGVGGPGGQGYEGDFGTGNGPGFARRRPPRYPLQAKRLNKEGAVVLRLSIDDKGGLTQVEVLETAGYGFEEEALAAVKASTYHPAVRDGRPAPSRARLLVQFRLH